MANDNKSIGRFMLDGVLPAPRGTPQIEVKFDINRDGILAVSARDKGTGKEQKIVIQSGSGLAKDEIERMVDEARTHEAADQQKRVEIETRNQADSLVYSTEKMLRDNADKVPEDLKVEVEGKLTTLKAALATNNFAEIQPAVAELNSSVQRLGEAVYSQVNDQAQAGGGDPFGGTPFDGGETSDGGPSASGPGTDSEGGDTVEGEFREV
jgi:molecular chaperone DnaK